MTHASCRDYLGVCSQRLLLQRGRGALGGRGGGDARGQGGGGQRAEVTTHSHFHPPRHNSLYSPPDVQNFSTSFKTHFPSCAGEFWREGAVLRSFSCLKSRT